jgi:hypothetical protein
VNHRGSVDNCNRCQNQGFDNALGSVRRRPEGGSDDIRHRDDVTFLRAWIRNLGICRLDAKGEIQAVNP